MKNEESLINVLLVEDEETLALIIKDTLEGQGFCIRLAKDGEEGLRQFFEEKPDVLVADGTAAASRLTLLCRDRDGYLRLSQLLTQGWVLAIVMAEASDATAMIPCRWAKAKDIAPVTVATSTLSGSRRR